MKDKAIFITRSNVSLCSKNTNVYRKALEVATKYDATLYVSKVCGVPREIAEKYAAVVRFRRVWDVLSRRGTETQRGVRVFTGFDFPCMYVGWQLKKRYGCKWTMFLWDPPCLSHRDGFPPLRWAIDVLFRFFAKRCDRLVLNIHPGLLDEIGYKPREGQLEFRMQDAWEGMDVGGVERVDGECFKYDFGVLANWSKAKGGELIAEAMKRMPGKKCLWIGDQPKDRKTRTGIEFVGRISQEDAFALLCKCRVLVVPYLSTRAFKWNYPLKLFEYLQLGRPIIASDNPGNTAIAERFKGRIDLFKSGNADDFIRIAKAV